MNVPAKAAVTNIFIRWCKFNLVGAMGMVVQLTALAIIDRFARGHYLYATAAAVEITLVHNFIWHLHFTWRDRRDGSVPVQFLRFQVSNGMVSLLGNLALMPMLVAGARIPLLVSNGIAILCCSIINFCLGHKWAFGVQATVMES
jgi:putative flippase GtrA